MAFWSKLDGYGFIDFTLGNKQFRAVKLGHTTFRYSFIYDFIMIN